MRIGILGGTFDPVHQGHVAMAELAIKEFSLDKVLVMPCKIPVHKAQATAPQSDRIAMLKLAFNTPQIELDLRELQRKDASYSVLSLQDLRAQHPNAALFFIIGMDSLNNLHTWHQWENCLKHAHFIVFGRQGVAYQPAPQVAPYIQSNEPNALFGTIYLSQHTPPMVASSELRATLAETPEKPVFLSDAVWNYIQKQRLYQLTSAT